MTTTTIRRSTTLRRVVATVLLAFLAFPLPLTAGSLPYDGAEGWLPRTPGRMLDTMSWRERLLIARVAPGGPITEEFLLMQKKEGYNAFNVSDAMDYDPVLRDYPRIEEKEIVRLIALADKLDMSMFVCIPLVVPLPVESLAHPTVASKAAARPLPMLSGRKPQSRFSAQSASVSTESMPGYILKYMSYEESKVRFRLWGRHNTGQIVGVYLSGDCPLFMGIPRHVQEIWTSIGADVAPSLPLLNMAGELALVMSPEEVESLFATKGFVGFLLINYMKNLGHVWGFPVNHLLASDPDDQVRRYQHTFMPAMRQALFPGVTGRIPLIVIPVGETFFYDGTDPGFIPRERDIELQVPLINEEIRTTFGQPENFSMGYFYYGAKHSYGLNGIWNVPGWAEAVAKQNFWLQKEY